ncbi:MAG: PEP-CTERM sorting domain-containing protein [Luteolibacter sp.]
MKKYLLSSLGVFALLPAANAALTINKTIGIDFGSVASTGASITFNDYLDDDIASGGTSGDVLSTSLVDSSGGAVTGVTFFVTNSTTKDSLTGFNAGQAGPSPFDVASVSNDAFIVNSTGAAPLSQANSTVLLTFTGLDDSLTYNLSGGFDPSNGNAIFDTRWTADGQTALTNIGGNGYISLDGLSTDGSSNLVITLNNGGGNSHVVVGGLTLTAVPEPSAVALLLGGMGMLALRRRRA